MKQKSPNPLYYPQTAANPLWPWFSFIFAVMVAVALFPRISQASTCIKNGSDGLCAAYDGLSIKFKDSSGTEITQAKINDTILIHIEVTDQALWQKMAGFGKNFYVGICNAKTDLPDCVQSTHFLNGPVDKNHVPSMDFNYTVGGQLSNPKNYTIGAIVEPSFVSTDVGNLSPADIAGIASFQVLAPDKTGAAKIDVKETGQIISGGVNKKFTISYSDGGTSQRPDSFTYSCGGGTADPKSPIDNTKISCTSAAGVLSCNSSFTCIYPYATSTYTGNVSASDSSGKTLVGSTPFEVKILGNEASQGSQSIGAAGSLSTVADGLTRLLNEIIAFILGLLQEIIFAVFSFLVAPLITSLLSIHVYQDSFVAVIYSGWEVVRNLCNIFFIVALIIIALATLFRVDSYKYKDLLVQLIIAALLVNFSLVIAQAVLGIADTVQAQFLSANVDVVKSLAKQLMLNTNSYLIQGFNGFAHDVAANNPNAAAQNGSFFGGIIQSFFWLALSLGTLGVFMAIAVYLLIRIVAIWLLLLVSPAAYAVGVLPATAHYREKWWTEFLKYAFFTPIMAFFLNMAAIMADNAKNVPILSQLANLNGAGNILVNVSSNILILVFLLAGIKVAEMAGIYGADMVTKVAKSPFAVAAGGGKLLGGYIGRRWNTATSRLRGDPNQRVSLGRAVAFAALNPVAWVKGMKFQSEERTHRAQAEAEAVGKEVAEQRFSNLLSPKAYIKGSYKINPHVFQHAKHDEDEQSKNLANLTLQEVVKRAYEIALMPNDQEGRAYKRGVIKLTMSKGHIDDITENMHTTEEGKKMMEKFDGMVGKGWFEKQDVFQMAERTPGSGVWEYTNTDENGVVSFVGKDKRQVITQNDISRRAMYVAMFGGEMHKGVDAYGDETLEFHLADHEADRLITQEGETEGLAGGHLEYMDMKYDPEAGHYESYKLVKQDEVINGVRTGRKMWVNTGSAEKQAVEIAKRNPRDQMGHLSPHALMSSDGKSYYLANWKKVSTGAAEAPQHIPDRLADRVVAGWLPTNLVDNIRRDFQVTHETVVNTYGPTAKSKLGTTDPTTHIAYPASAKMRIKLNDDDRLRLEAFAAENKRGVAGLFQKFMKNDGLLQNALVEGKYEIEVESPSGVHPLHLKG